MRYPRDMIGYGPRAPAEPWPDGTKIAVQFAVTATSVRNASDIGSP